MPDDPAAVDRALRQRWPEPIRQRLAADLRPAGVLIPIIAREDALSVLLTRRSARLRYHAGQVSFPGGGMEPGDKHILATALRETQEEVGIAPRDIEVAGYLPPAPTVTGYAVTPVVGLLAGEPRLSLDPIEVERAFEVPLGFLLDAANERHTEHDLHGVRVPVIEFLYDTERIWGATAGMLISLRQALLKIDK